MSTWLSLVSSVPPGDEHETPGSLSASVDIELGSKLSQRQQQQQQHEFQGSKKSAVRRQDSPAVAAPPRVPAAPLLDTESDLACESVSWAKQCGCWQWLRGKAVALRQRPLAVMVICVIMLSLMGLGIWGVIAAAQHESDSRKTAAWHAADEKALSMQMVLFSAFNPASIIASLAKQNPYNLSSLDATFGKIAPDIMNMTQSKGVFNIQLVPNGIIKCVSPILGFRAAPGLDLFQFKARRTAALAAVEKRSMVMSGPDMLAVGIYAFVGLHPVFVPDVDVNETFQFPHAKGVPNSLNPNNGLLPPYNQFYDRNIYDPAGGNCPPELCYIPEQRAKFWGFGKAVVTWEQSKLAAKLYDLCLEYDFLMTSSSVGKAPNVPIAMCSDERQLPTDMPGVMNGTIGPHKLEDYLPRDPVVISFSAFHSHWTLYVVPRANRSWYPSWTAPLIAAVVILDVMFTLLILMLLAGHVQQLQHLQVHKAARAALEQEKLHTDALVKRQLNLIACFADAAPAKGVPAGLYESHASLQEATLSRIEAVRRHLNAGQQCPGDEIVIQELLGSGAFGKVYKGLWRGGEVAIKTIVLSSSYKRQKMAIMEAAIASSMTHPNVVQTFTYAILPLRESDKGRVHKEEVHPGVQIVDNSAVDVARSDPDRRQSDEDEGNIVSYEVRLVQEYCDHGCLREALNAGVFFGTSFNYKAVLDTACDVAKAMLHLHQANVLHSDLKARNIMLKSSGTAGEGRGVVAKVADFGLSVSLDPTQTHMSDMYQGTMTHMAPEVVMKGIVSKSADVYAFGITMWELLTGGHAFKDIPGAHLGHAITIGKKRPTWGKVAPGDYVQLAETCWQEDPDARPTFREVLEQLQAMRRKLPGPTPFTDMTPVARAREAGKLGSGSSSGSKCGCKDRAGGGSSAFAKKVQQRLARRGAQESMWRSLVSVPEGRESDERERPLAASAPLTATADGGSTSDAMDRSDLVLGLSAPGSTDRGHGDCCELTGAETSERLTNSSSGITGSSDEDLSR